MRIRGSWAIAAVIGTSAVACSGNFDATRMPRPYADRATLGQEVYGVVCDRVGSSALGEDLSGDSFRSLCHPDDQGSYANEVDQSKLPPVSGGAALHRRLAVAKVEALARHRADLIRALDTAFPDIEVDDPHPVEGKPSKVRLHDAVKTLVGRLTPLYDSNPLAAPGTEAEPLVPAGTRALARVFDAAAESSRAQAAMARIGGREGYRPFGVALGAAKPLLLYPGLRSFAQQSIRVLSPGGPARAEFEQLLKVTHEEMAASRPSLPLSPLIINDPSGIAQPNRPRDNVELLQYVLLSPDASFAFPNTAPAPIVQRDPRGFALVAGTRPGQPGFVLPPFSDLFQDGPDGPIPGPDGMADVDAFGRFIDANGNPVLVDVPFETPGKPRIRQGDALGRALLEDGNKAYEYLDTQQTLVASLARDVRALADPNPSNDHETILNALAGTYVLAGDRVEGRKAVYEDGRELTYRGFDASTSPLVDLVHAAGQILSDPESDDFLQQFIALLQNNEQDLARVIGVALEMKRIADEHDEAGIPASSTLWDEMADVISKLAAVGPADGDPNGRSLLEDLIVALANEQSLLLGPAYGKFFKYKDRVTYNPSDINGGTLNLESQDTQPPHIEVDRSKPDSGWNRSAFQRSLQLIYDTTGVTACNKQGAKVHLVAGVLGLTVPADYPDDMLFSICGSKKQDIIAECSIYEVHNLSHFYVQSLLETDPNPPADFVNRKKATLVVKDACLQSLTGMTDMDQTFEDSSGLLGLTTNPTQTAMSRLVFFGADSFGLNMPEEALDETRHGTNEQLNRFLSDLQHPIGSPLCPKSASGLNVCEIAEDTLRMRDAATIFLWEHFGFNDAMRPLLRAFYDHDREDLFTDLVTVLNRHMSSKNHGPECEKKGSWRPEAPDFNPKYCAESGVVSYEPLLSEVLLGLKQNPNDPGQSDVIPALQRIAKVLVNQKIKSTRYRKGNGWEVTERRGSEVAASMVKALFNTDYAAKRQLADRSGKKSTLWSDGTTVKKQTTPFDLFANALKAMDKRFEAAPGFSAEDRKDRQTRWRKARSQLVDQFLSVDGSGASAKFRNPAISKALLRSLIATREQLNAQCPKRETGGGCEWARKELANKTAEVLEEPLFAAMLDLTDKLRADEGHAEIERVLQYLLNFIDDSEAMRAVLASSADIVQVLRDGQTLPPVFNVLARLSSNDAAEPGMPAPSAVADIALQLLQVLVTEPDDQLDPAHETEFDRYHVVEHLLANMVKPIDQGQPSKSVLEVFADTIADVQRVDSSDTGPLSADDYGQISRSVSELLTDPTRGVEQFYTIVRSRNAE